jgi:N-methylhydantoinase A/oxoprolinase/acetone carboxylase beta subunit
VGDEVIVYPGVRLAGEVSVYPRLKIPSGIRVPPGAEIAGPAVIEHPGTTIVLHSGQRARIDDFGNTHIVPEH